MKKILMTITATIALFSCTKQPNIVARTTATDSTDTTIVVPPVDTAWSSKTHIVKIVFNDGAEHNVFGYFAYLLNGDTIYKSHPVVVEGGDGDKPNYSFSNFNRGDTLNVILNGHITIGGEYPYSNTKVAIYLDDSLMALSEGGIRHNLITILNK